MLNLLAGLGLGAAGGIAEGLGWTDQGKDYSKAFSQGSQQLQQGIGDLANRTAFSAAGRVGQPQVRAGFQRAQDQYSTEDAATRAMMNRMLQEAAAGKSMALGNQAATNRMLQKQSGNALTSTQNMLMAGGMPMSGIGAAMGSVAGQLGGNLGQVALGAGEASRAAGQFAGQMAGGAAGLREQNLASRFQRLIAPEMMQMNQGALQAYGMGIPSVSQQASEQSILKNPFQGLAGGLGLAGGGMIQKFMGGLV